MSVAIVVVIVPNLHAGQLREAIVLSAPSSALAAVAIEFTL